MGLEKSPHETPSSRVLQHAPHTLQPPEREAAVQAGEKLWRLPLEDEYMEQLKSSVADMKNTGTRYGGSITAALYLKEFVDTKNVEWAHIDMAGPVWDDREAVCKWATSFLMRLQDLDAVQARHVEEMW